MLTIALFNKQRYVLTAVLLGTAKNIYEQALALEVQKLLEFSSDEIKKAGIHTEKTEKGTVSGIKWDVKKDRAKKIELRDTQRTGILTMLGRLPKKSLEDWTVAGIVSQLHTTSDELLEFLSAAGEKEEKTGEEEEKKQNVN